jgi:predicted dienelactone hydrolase
MMTQTKKKILLGLSVLLVLAAISLAALAAYVLIYHQQPLTLPAPTGSYPVGRIAYGWVDESRTDPLSDNPSEKRELLAWIWYPATISPQDPDAPYLPPAWVEARNKDQGIGTFIENDFLDIRTHSVANAPFAATPSPFPVLIMQPGMGPAVPDYTTFAENLASHGYIVVGANPTYTSNLVVFPNGRVVLRSAKGTIPDSADAVAADKDANRIGKVWADDVRFVMDQLSSLNSNPSSPFYNKLDLERMGDFGHSFGGATAVHVCEIDARCKAAADLDGTLFSDQAGATIRRPILFMAEDGCGVNCDTMHQKYFSDEAAAYYLTVSGAKHFNFSDLPLRLNPLMRIVFGRVGIIGSIQPERGLEISNAYLVAFFDRYLKGVNSALLQDASADYPEVQVEWR